MTATHTETTTLPRWYPNEDGTRGGWTVYDRVSMCPVAVFLDGSHPDPQPGATSEARRLCDAQL